MRQTQANNAPPQQELMKHEQIPCMAVNNHAFAQISSTPQLCAHTSMNGCTTTTTFLCLGPLFTRSIGGIFILQCRTFPWECTPGNGSSCWVAQVSACSFSNATILTWMHAHFAGPRMRRRLTCSPALTPERPSKPRLFIPLPSEIICMIQMLTLTFSP